VNAVKRVAPFKVTQDDNEHIACLFETLPTELSEGQMQLSFCRGIQKCFRKDNLILGTLI